MRRLPSQPLTSTLLNTSQIELWPADLLRVRSNADARILAVAHAVLRRKHDGRYLAAVSVRGVHPLVPGLPREPGLDEAWDALKTSRAPRVASMRMPRACCPCMHCRNACTQSA